MWTNGDEVQDFIEAHKGGQWSVGDRLVLPDIEQAYEVIAVRPFKRRGKFKLFVDLEAACAVDGCEEYLITTKEVHQWMGSPYLPRCCPNHRFGFSTPMQDAWKTSAQREEAEEQRAAKVRAKAEIKLEPRFGRNEQAVLDAAQALSLIADRASTTQVLDQAIELLPPAENGKRDTRRQNAFRALKSLVKATRITVRDGVVLL